MVLSWRHFDDKPDKAICFQCFVDMINQLINFDDARDEIFWLIWSIQFPLMRWILRYSWHQQECYWQYRLDAELATSHYLNNNGLVYWHVNTRPQWDILKKSNSLMYVIFLYIDKIDISQYHYLKKYRLIVHRSTRTKFSEFSIQISTLSFKKKYLKTSSVNGSHVISALMCS